MSARSCRRRRRMDGTRRERNHGTRIAVELWATDKAQGNAAIEAVLAEMRRVDEAMSTYKPTSELSIVNARAAQEPIKISPELFDLLSTALEYSRITDGAFDITYASVGYMYDFRSTCSPTRNKSPRVARHQLPARRAGQNTAHVRFTRPACVSISAASARVMRSIAASRFCRDAASSTRSSPRAATAASSAIVSEPVGRRHPSSGSQRRSDRAHSAGGCRALDVGRLRALLRRGGVRYHHIIDPKTGHRRARFAARPSSDRRRRAPTGCRRLRSCSAPSGNGNIQPLGRHRRDLGDAGRQVLYSKGLEAPSQ